MKYYKQDTITNEFYNVCNIIEDVVDDVCYNYDIGYSIVYKGGTSYSGTTDYNRISFHITANIKFDTNGTDVPTIKQLGNEIEAYLSEYLDTNMIHKNFDNIEIYIS